MKALLISSLMFSSMSFGQTLDLGAFKNLLTQRQATLEKVNAGMSKKILTTTRIPTELGFCEIKESAIQTVLKIDGDKMIVHSKETYVPAATSACAGFESSSARVLFYEAKPNLSNDIEDLNATAAAIQSIEKAGEVVSVSISADVDDENGNTRTENVTVKYDLSKSSFKNLISLQDSTSTVITEDISDIDVNSVDLSNVFFCESDDSESCVEGNFSDILF